MTYGNNKADHYPPSSKLFHWAVAICVLTIIPVAIIMVNIEEGPTQDFLFQFHKSLGVLILILMTLRLINRLIVGAPMADPEIEPWQRSVSSIVHTSLYVLLFAMSILGYVAHSVYGAPTPFFGLFEIPPVFSKNEELSEQLFTVHQVLGLLVAALVLMHIGGALYHRFIRGDHVLQRMLPRALGGI
jgi:cytochrome b561